MPTDARFAGQPNGGAGRLTEVVIGSERFTVDMSSGVVSALAVEGGDRELHRARTRSAITEEVRAGLRAWIMGTRIPPPSDTLEDMFRRMGDVGDPLPAWQAVLADPSGRLWLELPRCMVSGPASYQVIDTEGRSIATIDVPPELRLRAVRGDRALTVRIDALDVEHVELYRILSEGGASR